MTTVTNVTKHTCIKVRARTITSPYRKASPPKKDHWQYLWDNQPTGPRLDTKVDYNAIVSALRITQIVDNYFDGTSVTDEDDCSSLAQEAVLDGRVDLTAVNDRFQWYWERGIELGLLDTEDRIEQAEEELACMEDKGRRWRYYLNKKGNPESKAKFDKFVRQYKAKRYDYRRFVNLVDSNFYTEDIQTDTPTEGEALEIYLRMYIKHMDLGTLAIAMDEIDRLKNEGKIGWYHYVMCGLSVSYRLAKATDGKYKAGRSWKDVGWWEVCDRMFKHKLTHHSKYASPGTEDRMHGTVGAGMDRLDDIMCIEDIADQHDLTPQEVLLTWDDEDQAELTTDNTSPWEAMLAQACVG